MKLNVEEKLRRYIRRKYMRDVIMKELDTVYTYKNKRFLTKEEAKEYRTLVEHIKNEKELDKEWNKIQSKKRLNTIESLWKEG